MCPDVDNLVVTFLIGDKAHAIFTADALNLLITLTNEFFLLFGNNDITKVEGQTTFVCQTVTKVFDTIEELAGTSHTYSLDNVGNDATKSLFRDYVIEEAYLLGDDLISNDTTNRGLYHALAKGSILKLVVDHHKYWSMYIDALFIVCNDGFLGTIELQTCTLCARTKLGDIVQTEHHVLRRNGDRCTVGRVQNIVRLKHQNLSLKDCLIAQRQMHSHLVAVEVGIERRTSQRMKLNCLTLNHLWLESLNTETVKCRSTVQQNGVTLHDELEDIPNDWILTVNNLLGTLHGLNNTALNEFTDNEGFVKFCCHEFGKTALAHLQLRTNNNNRTCRIVNALTQQVLTEAALLTLQ